jgi:hypothetical protein
MAGPGDPELAHCAMDGSRPTDKEAIKPLAPGLNLPASPE